MTIRPEDLATLDYAFQGVPYYDTPGNSSINIETMDYAYRGLPFVGVGVSAAGGNIDPFGMMGFYGI